MLRTNNPNPSGVEQYVMNMMSSINSGRAVYGSQNGTDSQSQRSRKRYWCSTCLIFLSSKSNFTEMNINWSCSRDMLQLFRDLLRRLRLHILYCGCCRFSILQSRSRYQWRTTAETGTLAVSTTKNEAQTALLICNQIIIGYHLHAIPAADSDSTFANRNLRYSMVTITIRKVTP